MSINDNREQKAICKEPRPLADSRRISLCLCLSLHLSPSLSAPVCFVPYLSISLLPVCPSSFCYLSLCNLLICLFVHPSGNVSHSHICYTPPPHTHTHTNPTALAPTTRQKIINNTDARRQGHSARRSADSGTRADARPRLPGRNQTPPIMSGPRGYERPVAAGGLWRQSLLHTISELGDR